MPDVLIFADTVTTPEMRHEVPVLVPDPFLYAEKGGKKITMSTAFEVDRIAEAGIEAHPYEEFGYDDLLAEGKRNRVDIIARERPPAKVASRATLIPHSESPSAMTEATSGSSSTSRTRMTKSYRV